MKNIIVFFVFIFIIACEKKMPGPMEPTNYELCAEYLTSHNIDTAKRRWIQRRSDPEAISFHEAYNDLSIIVQQRFSTAMGVHSTTGEIIWQSSIPRLYGHPRQLVTADQYLLIFPDGSHSYSELDMVSGKIVFQDKLSLGDVTHYKNDVYICTVAHLAPEMFITKIIKKPLGQNENWEVIISDTILACDSLNYNALAVVNNDKNQRIIIIERIISSRLDKKEVIAFNENVSEVVWRKAYDADFISHLFTIGNDLYYNTGFLFHKISPTDGSILWTVNADHHYLIPPIYDQKSVILLDVLNKRMLSVDQASGSLNWDVVNPDTNDNTFQFLNHRGNLYFFNSYSIVQIDMKDGKILKQIFSPSFDCNDFPNTGASFPYLTTFSINTKHNILVAGDTKNFFGIELP